MSVQTRTQLQTSAATITNETTAAANTAARVGGLFDDLADTATLDRASQYGEQVHPAPYEHRQEHHDRFHPAEIRKPVILYQPL